MHKTANLLNKLPVGQQAKAKQASHQIWMAECRVDAEQACDLFLTTYAAKYPKAAEWRGRQCFLPLQRRHLQCVSGGANNGVRSGANWGQGEGWNDNTPGSFPDWLQIEFAGNQTIDEINAFAPQDNWRSPVEPTETMTFSQLGLSGFDVQYWNGSSWVTVPGGSVTGNNLVWRKFTFAAVTTSKIRVLTNASASGWSRLTEVEAWTAASGSSSSSEVLWLVADHLGTPRIILDQTGSLANIKRHDYLPFGEELFAGTGGRTTAQGYTASDNVRQKFTSKERDVETGLDYFGERYFSSSLGRFTTPDPLGGSIRANNPQTTNRYTYVLNNPLRYVDPNGLQEKDAWDHLTGAERKAIATRLDLKKGETARDAFNRLVTVSGDSTATAANIQSVQNFIAQAGGLKNSETWQQISAITKVTPQGQAPLDLSKSVLDSSGRQSSDLEIRVADKGKFLTALRKDPLNSFVVDSLGDEALKKAGLSWHPFNNARATTDYRSDPQLHYSNDKSDDSNFGPNYFFVHWDITSSIGRESTFVGDVRGGLGHGPRGTVGQVNQYLKRTQQVPR